MEILSKEWKAASPWVIEKSSWHGRHLRPSRNCNIRDGVEIHHGQSFLRESLQNINEDLRVFWAESSESKRLDTKKWKYHISVFSSLEQHISTLITSSCFIKRNSLEYFHFQGVSSSFAIFFNGLYLLLFPKNTS